MRYNKDYYNELLEDLPPGAKIRMPLSYPEQKQYSANPPKNRCNGKF